MSSQWHLVTLNGEPARGEVVALSHKPVDYSPLQVAVAVAVAKALDRGALFVMQPPEDLEEGS